ncbi:hypothetical protein ACSBLW_03355 [Thioclava sp. FR2]|uniref:hypothetical protein n=1 Tax=Thioclava sp. FR2 TaxID=3445780 RepID=UPI003EB7217C
MSKIFLAAFSVAFLSLFSSAGSADTIRCEFPNKSSHWVPSWVEFELVGFGGSAKVRDQLSEKFGLPLNQGKVSEGRKSIGVTFTTGPIISDNVGYSRAHLNYRLSTWADGAAQIEGKGFGYYDTFSGRGYCK